MAAGLQKFTVQEAQNAALGQAGSVLIDDTAQHTGPFVAITALEDAAVYKLSDKTILTASVTSDGKQYGLRYERFVPMLVKALQELSAKNDALEARIKKLEDG